MFEVFRRELKLLRRKIWYNEQGLVVEDAKELTITASVQSPSYSKLMTLDEGYRTKDIKVLITSTELQLSKVEEQNADLVVIDGSKYQVIAVSKEESLNYCIDHYEAIVMRLDNDNVN